MTDQLAFSFGHLLFSPRCQGCRRRLPPGSASYCRACIRLFLGAPRFRGALFENLGPARGFLRALRGSAPERAATWAFFLLERRGWIETWKRDQIEIVTHAPQNARRARSGLAILAEAVARETGASFVPRAFRKRDGRRQHGRSAASRMDTHCFVELTRPKDWVRGKAVLVLDDVNTTGTTLDLCAFALREAGASRVRRFALAQQAVNEGQ